MIQKIKAWLAHRKVVREQKAIDALTEQMFAQNAEMSNMTIDEILAKVR